MTDMIEINLPLLREHALPRADDATDKDSRGRVFMIAGSELSPGAALLSGTSALRGGAGKVVVATIAPAAITLGLLAPEFGIVSLASSHGEPTVSDEVLDYHLDKCDAVLLGPGMSEPKNALGVALRLLQKCRNPVVLDAAAISALAEHFDAVKESRAHCILTPHAGEMAALTGKSKEAVEADPVQVASDTARALGCTIILKGATTYVVTRDGHCWKHVGGVRGLATAGSGDTLAGLLVGLLARGADEVSACCWSVAVHAKAGSMLTDRLGEVGLLARELPTLFPQIMRNWA
ncbi:MAG: NAD(P)H-hydrate dehydratase [Pseudomonadota bacterium]|nr:NAD(P)H-hydrate dehydratase [Pseudomonadota bacterium]